MKRRQAISQSPETQPAVAEVGAVPGSALMRAQRAGGGGNALALSMMGQRQGPDPVQIDASTADSVRAGGGDSTKRERAAMAPHRQDLATRVAAGVGPAQGGYVRARWSEFLSALTADDPAAGLARARITGALAQGMVLEMIQARDAATEGDAASMEAALMALSRDLWSGWVDVCGGGRFSPPPEHWARTRAAAQTPDALLQWMEQCVSAAVERGYDRVQGGAQSGGKGGGQPLDARGKALHETTLSRHAIVEVFAHETAYAKVWGERALAMGLDSLYTFTEKRNDKTGFSAIYATPINRSGYPPVLAFTGSDDFFDVLADIDPDGKTGQKQFRDVLSAVRSLLPAMKTPTIFTGHSLGGCLAQLAAAVFKPQGVPISEVVTFNAPGIPARLIGGFERAQRGASEADKTAVTHYTRAEDPVSRAGEAALPGVSVRLISNDLASKGDVGGAHTRQMIGGSDGAHRLNADAVKVSDGAHLDDGDREVVGQARIEVGKLVAFVIKELDVDLPRDFAEWSLRELDWASIVGSIGSPVSGAQWIRGFLAGLKGHMDAILPLIGRISDPSLRSTLRGFLVHNVSTIQSAINRGCQKYAFAIGIRAVFIDVGETLTFRIETHDDDI